VIEILFLPLEIAGDLGSFRSTTTRAVGGLLRNKEARTAINAPLFTGMR